MWVSSDYNFLHEGIRTSLFCKDINNDGFDEMWIGNYAGGVSFYKGIAFTGVEASVNVSSDLKIFPNPAHEFITIQIPASHQNGILNVYDISGRNLITQQLAQQNLSHSFSVRDLQKGVYFIVIAKEGMRSISEKMLVK